ncbi:MAG: N-acetylmuramoyl-L-alanine amidase family protein [Peptococcales bacterium]|jgi:N-acetylmuramoyl-L-alanine amidase
MLIVIKKRKIGNGLLMFFLLFILFGVIRLVGQNENIIPVLASNQRIILIDPGHGGKDPGAVFGDILEKNINLEVARLLSNRLKKEGFKVSQTRIKDTNLVDWKDNGSYQRASLWQRANLSRKKNADVLVSIHCNSDKNRAYFGPQTFYHRESLEGKALAQAIQEELLKVRQSKRQAIPGDFYLLKNTFCITVIVEIGYLSNYTDRTLLCSPKYQKMFAEAIAEGISNYFRR